METTLNSDDREIKGKIIKYVDSKSMTLAKAAMNSFSRINCPERILFQIYSSINGKIIVSFWIVGSHLMHL